MSVCVIQACNQFNGSEKNFLSITYAGQVLRNATLLT